MAKVEWKLHRTPNRLRRIYRAKERRDMAQGRRPDRKRAIEYVGGEGTDEPKARTTVLCTAEEGRKQGVPCRAHASSRYQPIRPKRGRC